ncbi:5'-nucleotidase [Klebsiella michiganensis]|uniref:5'-nucleotidase n=1 Tax=Klebsiella michiganensis TaxID=1134687 RepID=A0A7H4M0Y2_9ENTR|nr:5'-nucleotidase [Klebsiella michiganensis]
MRTKILTAAILALSAAGVQAAEKPLKILLVNDDGCQSVGDHFAAGKTGGQRV